MKTVLVTGSSRGLGAVTAKKFGEQGYNVIVNYNSSEEPAQKVVQEIGDNALAVRADVRDRAQVDEMVKRSEEKFGRIDVVVNNALIDFKFDPVAQKSFKDLSWQDVQGQIDGTLKGAFNVIQAVLPAMIEQGSGQIVNIGTNLFQNPVVPYHEYTTAKAALLGMTRNLAAEVGQFGITANMVSGGLLKMTDASAVTTEEVFELIASTTPLRQVTTPEDVANMVVYLSSDAACGVTGQNITVDGGLTMN